MDRDMSKPMLFIEGNEEEWLAFFRPASLGGFVQLLTEQKRYNVVVLCMQDQNGDMDAGYHLIWEESNVTMT